MSGSSLPKTFHSKEKKYNRKLLQELRNILQVALEVPTPSPTEYDANMPIELQQPPPPSLKPEILRLRTWFPTTLIPTNETSLDDCIRPAQDIMRQKVDNIARMHDIIRYSQLIWKGSTPPWKSWTLRLDSLKNFTIKKCLHNTDTTATVSVVLTGTKPQDRRYVIKVIPKTKMVWKNRVNQDRMTILQLERDSSFVAKLYIAFQSKRNLYLVMRYINGGDCAALDKPLDEIRTKKYIAGVVLAIGFLHQNNIVHRFVSYKICIFPSAYFHLGT